MAIIFLPFLSEGLALQSYLIGDDEAGKAAVIDPAPDVDLFLQSARRHGLAITHIVETHIHADFMSGSRELAAFAPGSRIFVSAESKPAYSFEHEPLHGGDRLEIGSVILTARHTPGHTPEHLSFEVADREDPDAPWGVFSGDALFVGSAGRPDLLGSEQAEDLANQLFASLNRYFAQLDGGVLLFPAHGAGSPCGADIGDRPSSTIGHERDHNPFLQFDGRPDAFVEFALDAPEAPTYYPRMKELNLRGPIPTLGLPRVPALNLHDFTVVARDAEQQLIDTRSLFAFAGGHIPGALNIGGSPLLSVWAGWMVDPDKDIFLVLDDDETLEPVLRLFLRVGLTRFGGYLCGGMKRWAHAGLPLSRTRLVPVNEVKDRLRHGGQDLQLVDVRSRSEYEAGHLDAATHLFVPDLSRKATNVLDPSLDTITYCGSGYRASLAASLLEGLGFTNVGCIPSGHEASPSERVR